MDRSTTFPRPVSIRTSLLMTAFWIGLMGFMPLSTYPASAWHDAPGHRWRELLPSEVARAGAAFIALDPGQTGLLFTNALSEEAGAANRVLYNGAGVAAGDIHGDGLPDLFFCHLGGTNALFRNLGNGRFENVTTASGLGAPIPETRGAVFADINGDRALDLLLTVNGHGVLVFLNDGHGRFSDITESAGTRSHRGSTSLALADADGNGSLDLYVTNYRPDDIRDRGRVRMTMIRGRPYLPGSETNRFVLIHGRLEECGQPDQFYLNDGKGRFREVSWTDGSFLDEQGQALSEPPLDWGLTAAFHDLTGDGAPDLYVCNDYWTPDRCWINDGTGRFRAITQSALRKTSASSMSIDFADLNRDGHPDFFVVDMLSRYPAMRKRQAMAQTPTATPIGVLDDRPQVMRNTLFLNRGDATFAETAWFAGLPASDWSWAPLFTDVDLDGFPDLLIGAGHFRDVQDYDAERQVQSRQRSYDGFPTDAARQQVFTRELLQNYRLYPRLDLPIGGFRNRGDATFEETTDAWGLNLPGIHQGLALLDIDADGDLDLAVNSLNGPAMLLRHESQADRVAVRLRGSPPNTEGIGAHITLVGGAIPRQTAEVSCGGHYQSGSEALVVFAATPNVRPLSLEVRWRNGKVSRISGVQPNRLYLIDESGSQPAQPASSSDAPATFFEDVSPVPAVVHREMEFDDFQRQPLLPFKLSQLGPGIVWSDLNRDGHEDLVMGTGRGSTPTLLLGDGSRLNPAPPSDPALAVQDDTAALVVWNGSGETPRLFTALTGYEATLDQALLAWSFKDGRLTPDPVPAPPLGQASALALGDVGGDGAWMLFVGGGVLPGQYPLGAPSQLLRWDGRQWVQDARQNVVFANLGIVNGAVWSDLTDDGVPELILACEWGPIRVFQRRGASLIEVTQDWGLSPYTGWWRSVTTGDLNGDGRLDIIAANWGRNSPYRATPERPLTFAFGQVAQPGVTEVIETEYVEGVLSPRRQFMALARSMPYLMAWFPTQKAYSEATLDQVLGDRLPLSRRVTATTLASTVFLNAGNRFEPVELPPEAQWAPAFSVHVADFDTDGHEDLFLSQNFFDLQPETSRIDAGVGLWLRGDGSGRMAAVPTPQSGIRVFGEQRGAAVADFDEDGRPDLAISQNGAALKIYRNRGATPGLRIRLRGAATNPGGVGAVLQLVSGGRPGPARELHAGSGHGSQDSPVQVFAAPRPPAELKVRWPGGRTTSTPVPQGARELTVAADGSLVAQK